MNVSIPVHMSTLNEHTDDSDVVVSGGKRVDENGLARDLRA